MRPPDWLMGRHATSPEDLREWVHRLLADEAGVHNHEKRLYFENAGDIVFIEDEYTVTLQIPLPYLNAADVTTDEIQEALAPCTPAGAGLDVEVAPPP